MTASSEKPGAPEDPAAPVDTYHDHDSALKWALRLETVAWFPLILAVLSFLVLAAELYVYLPQVISAGAFEAYLSVSLPILIPLSSAILGAAFFVLLRAASQTLLVLLDIYDKPAAS